MLSEVSQSKKKLLYDSTYMNHLVKFIEEGSCGQVLVRYKV